MEHLDTQVLEQWARGELPPEEAGACELHTARCAPCAQAHARVRAGLAAAPAEPDTLAPGAPAPAPPLPPLLCGTAIGRFLVLEKRGQGGFGEVYAAYDPTLDRRVALKLLRPGADARGQRHLLREAQTMARLSHPNLLPVFDAGEHAGRVFIAMELVEGTTVARWLRAAARPWREVVRVFVEAGRGLAAAHAAGVVHRDFKPDNALITPAGRVVVMDFGLARAHAHAPCRRRPPAARPMPPPPRPPRASRARAARASSARRATRRRSR